MSKQRLIEHLKVVECDISSIGVLIKQDPLDHPALIRRIGYLQQTILKLSSVVDETLSVVLDDFISKNEAKNES